MMTEKSMDGTVDEPVAWYKTPIWIGVIITIPWLCSILAYVVGFWCHVKNLEPNALGDFFAGAFAPLAFLWLVVAVLLQRKELADTRRAQVNMLGEHRKATAREFDVQLSKNLDTLGDHIRIRSGDLQISRPGRNPLWPLGRPKNDDSTYQVFKIALTDLAPIVGTLEKGEDAQPVQPLLFHHALVELYCDAEDIVVELAKDKDLVVTKPRVRLVELRRFMRNIDRLINWSRGFSTSEEREKFAAEYEDE